MSISLRRISGRGVCAAAIFAGLFTICRQSPGGDWPQILGPSRNGQADGESLPPRWPAGGPKTLWRSDLGAGFAGPVAAAGRVIVFHRSGDKERIESFDADSGRRQWSVDFPAYYRGGVNADLGPRATPLIHEGAVYVFGAAGDLHSVELANGRKRWSRSAYEEFGGDEGYFGAGATPIVADGKLLVNIGGRSGAGIVAFALDTGEPVWKATDEAASYSSPAAATIGGQPQVIFATRLSAVAVSPNNGEVLYRFAFGKRGPTVTAATPLVFDGQLFLSASYGVGARLAKLGPRSADVVWERDDVMSSQYSTCVEHNGYLYGAHGREDIGRAELRCVEAKSGTVQWSAPNFGVAHLILAGERLLVLSVEGELVLAEASPAKFKELSRAQIASDTTRALPALAGGKLYLRTNDARGGKLLCVEVGGKE